MSETTILKSKRLTIKVKFAPSKSPDIASNIHEYVKLEIRRESGEVDVYEQDPEGVAKLKNKPFTLGKTLTEFALQEKRSFYKSLLQKYGEIENLVILSGAGSSVDIGVENKGLTMAGLWDSLAEEQTSSLITLIKESKYHEVDESNQIVNPESLVKDLESLLSISSITNFVLKKKEVTDAIKITRQFIAKK